MEKGLKVRKGLGLTFIHTLVVGSSLPHYIQDP